MLPELPLPHRMLQLQLKLLLLCSLLLISGCCRLAIAVSAAATKAAAVAATFSAGSGPPAGLERRLRLSTQAACLRRSCSCLRAFARRLPPRAGARWLLVGGVWQEKSKCWKPPRVSRTTLHQPRAATHSRYCCSKMAAAGSRKGVSAIVSADPRQVECPCMGGGVGPDISTPPQGGGGEGAGRREGSRDLFRRELAVH